MNKKVRTIFLFCFICFSSIIILEFIARYIIRQPYYAFPEGYFINNEFYGYELAENFKGKYSQPEFTIDISTNSQGLRDVEHYSGKGEFKILALGDSFSFGVGVELEDTYLSGLEQSLNDKNGTKFSIIKAGVVGYSTFNEKIYLEKKGLNYHPDMVVIQFWWDDLGIGRVTYLAETGFLTSGKISNVQLRIFLNRHFRSYALIRRLFTLAASKSLFAPRIPAITENQASLNDEFSVTLEQFKEIISFCSNNQIPYLFLLIPPKEFLCDDNAIQCRWRLFCELLSKNNVRYFDALPSLRAAVLKGEQVFFKIDPHLNKNGHKIIAKVLEQQLFK
ncbi:MAG: SGNH/GDSL hydrolase family protein [Candidatus Omnitrophota bacterium]